MNANFLIDGPRGYISNTIAFFIWLTYSSIHRWNKTNNDKYFIISLFFAGFVAGTKLHSIFILFFLGLFIFFKSKENVFNSQQLKLSLKNTFIFFTFSFIIASHWYVRNFYYTGDPIYPYLSKSFLNSIEQGTAEANLLNPHLWSGVEATVSNLLKPIFLMLTNPHSLSYGWYFGILMIGLIPFYFIINNEKYRLLTLLLIISYYVFWFFTHQNVRYILYIYPILFSFSFINAYRYLDTIWRRKYVRQLTYVAVAVLFVNSIFHSMVYANWWRTDKLLIKPNFYRQYDSYLRSNYYK